MIADRQAIQQTIRDFLKASFPAARHRPIGDDDPLMELAIVDSLGVLDIVAFLESTYGLQIADDELELEDFASITALADFVLRKLHANGVK